MNFFIDDFRRHFTHIQQLFCKFEDCKRIINVTGISMDIVIAYVDGLDPVWQKDYEKYMNAPVLTKRFRDWGTLKYLLRGIQYQMPFIENVYLVVSHESQVPQWVDGENLKVVLHKEFIPEEYLPTFNSTTISLFLHRIPGLSEQFMYFNDDIFPVGDCKAEDYFRNGKVSIGISTHLFVSGMYKHHVKRSNQLARKALGKFNSPFFIRPQHSCIPMLKSECEKVFAGQETEIRSSISRIRSNDNYNMSLYMSYMYYQGKVINKRIACKHVSMAAVTPSNIGSYITSPTKSFVCINDVSMSEEKYAAFRQAMIDAFETRFPTKSRFEK